MMGAESIQRTHTHTHTHTEIVVEMEKKRWVSERLKRFLTNEWCVGESNSVRESEADNRIDALSHFR